MITPDKCFEYGFIATPQDMVGKSDLIPCWNVQYLGDGTQDFVETRREVFQWIAEWYDIGDSAYPDWLRREID
jgi:hypothetical protein